MPFGRAEQAAGLLDLSNNKIVPTDYLDWYLDQGFVETIHDVTQEPIERSSSNAMIRITPSGWDFMQGR